MATPRGDAPSAKRRADLVDWTETQGPKQPRLDDLVQQPNPVSAAPVAAAVPVVADAPVAGPAPRHGFLERELVTMTATRARKRDPYHYIASRVEPDGSLTGQCSGKCSGKTVNPPKPMECFTPGDNHNSGPRRAIFQGALDDYLRAIARGDVVAARAARAIVEKTRKAQCDGCTRPTGELSPRQRACYDTMVRIYGAMGLCVRCGEQPATQADHKQGFPKTLAISAYMHWPDHGGATAQEREYNESCEDTCADCHRLDDMTHAANRLGDPRNLPRGKRRGTKEEHAQYLSRRHAKITFPKYQFVDRVKLAFGVEFTGKRIVAQRVSNAREVNVVAVDLDHFDRCGELLPRFAKVPYDGDGKWKKPVRMSPCAWCRLQGKEFTLGKIGYTWLIPDLLRTRPVTTSVHMSWNKEDASPPLPSLEDALEYERKMRTAIDYVLATYYPNGLVDEPDDEIPFRKGRPPAHAPR